MKDTRYRAALVAFRRELIATTLRDHGGNRTRAARALGVGRTYLIRLIRDLDVNQASCRTEGEARGEP